MKEEKDLHGGVSGVGEERRRQRGLLSSHWSTWFLEKRGEERQAHRNIDGVKCK